MGSGRTPESLLVLLYSNLRGGNRGQRFTALVHRPKSLSVLQIDLSVGGGTGKLVWNRTRFTMFVSST